MDRAPEFDTDMWPETEREGLLYVSRNLDGLGNLVTSFRRMLDLYKVMQVQRALHDKKSPVFPDWDESPQRHMSRIATFHEEQSNWSEAGRALGEWAQTAVLHSVMICYGFKKVAAAITTNLASMPTARQSVMHEKRRTANTKFNEAFPDIESLRLLAAHPGELGSTPDDWERHSSAGPYSDGVISTGTGSMVTSFSFGPDAARFTGTSRTKMVEFELSEDQLFILSHCALDHWVAFEPLESESSKWRRSVMTDVKSYGP